MYTLKSDAGHIERMTSLPAFSHTTTRRLHMKPRRQAAAFAMGCVFTLCLECYDWDTCKPGGSFDNDLLLALAKYAFFFNLFACSIYCKVGFFVFIAGGQQTFGVYWSAYVSSSFVELLFKQLLIWPLQVYLTCSARLWFWVLKCVCLLLTCTAAGKHI